MTEEHTVESVMDLLESGTTPKELIEDGIDEETVTIAFARRAREEVIN